MGRLGNQLFQIAATVGYALDNGHEYRFENWEYQEYIKLPLGVPEGVYKSVRENNLRFTELEKFNGNVDLHGHFLSEKYFAKHRKEIIKLFKPEHPEGMTHLTKRALTLPTRETCAIHVRRGDYVNEEQQKAHGLLGMDYYNNAINIIKTRHPNVEFIICSDDIPWCVENFKIKATYVHHAVDIEDLIFMSNCTHNIISNSTFGWWSAWLNYNNTVVAPKQWFAETEGWDDLYRYNWIRI